MQFRSRPFALLLGSLFLAACGGGSATVDDPGGGDAEVDTSTDTGSEETSDPDTGTLDTGTPDTSVPDTGPADTGPADTGPADTGPADTGPADTGPADTGPSDSGGPTDCKLDSDGDGIPDFVEGRYATPSVDTDGDGTPDYLDLDSDGDGITDKLEWYEAGCSPTGGNDADGDGIANYRDLDADGNGLPDKDEVCPPAAVLTALGKPACVAGTPYDFDGDGIPDYLDPDNDHDSSAVSKFVGLNDEFELADATGKYVGLTLDTDGDGIPDVYDHDSDGDGIPDHDDGLNDVDKDGKQNFRDTDSDGDGVLDSCEKTVDTDGDGKADFVDLDSDGDLLPDRDEDKNGNCVLNTGETDRLKKDTDGDGHDDLVEVTLTPVGDPSWARDPSKTPWNQSKFYFIEPYSPDGSAAPSPASTPLALNTSLQKGDVAFQIDTSNSMLDIETALANSIATKIIPGLQAKIPDLELGVIGYDDVLAKPWGDSVGDSFIWFPNAGDPARGSRMTASTTDATNAAKGLNKTTSAGTYPEGSIPALWWSITGDSFTFRACSSSTAACGGTVYPDVTKTFAGASPPAGRFGGQYFRNDALPIVIQASDANFHNGLTTLCRNGAGTSLPACQPISYTPEGAKASSLGHSPDITELRDKMVSLGARYIGVSVHGGTTASGSAQSSLVNRTTNPEYYASALDMLYLARGTGSKVPPSVLGGTATDCKTSNSGATATNPADADGRCPLVFDIRYDGAGLGDTIVNSVVALVSAIRLDVHVQAIPVLSGGVDPVNAFLANVPPMPGGGTDPVTGGTCVTFPATQTADRFTGPKALAGTDTVKETILDLVPGPLHCFAVTPKPNTSVPATTSVQIFRANLRAHAQKPTGATSPLGSDREVVFIVPPIVN